jgi:hypothetical protein
MYIDSEDTAREYIRAWTLEKGEGSTGNARRFLDTAKSQRAAAGLCRNEGEREARIAAARVLEAEAARIESDLIDTLTQPR